MREARRTGYSRDCPSSAANSTPVIGQLRAGAAVPHTAAAHTDIALHDSYLFREAAYIDGAWISTSVHGTIDVDNPATGDLIGTIPKLGAAETRQAIEAAHRAFPAWRQSTAKERAILLRRRFDLMMANQEDLAVGHADGERGRVLERIRHRQQQDLHANSSTGDCTSGVCGGMCCCRARSTSGAPAGGSVVSPVCSRDSNQI